MGKSCIRFSKEKMGNRGVPPTLASWVKQPITFMADNAADYNKLITSRTLKAEIQNAYEYVATLTELIPAGTTVATREIADVKEMLVANPEGVMFSGALTNLCLPERAISSIDSGRIGYIINAATTPCTTQEPDGAPSLSTQMSLIRASNGPIKMLKLMHCV